MGYVVKRSLVLGSSVLLATAAQAASVALLVGVGNYQPNGGVGDLLGPKNDVEALRQVLINQWGFEAKNVKTLINEQATHTNILRELNSLSTRSQAGDHVFVYFSGHGTSALDYKMSLPLPHTSGGFVPYDFSVKDFKRNIAAKPDSLGRHPYLNQHLIVGKWHLRPIFEQLEKDRTLTVMMDSCYSGNATRSITQAINKNVAVPKMMPMPHELFANDDSFSMELPTSNQADEAYPYKNTVSIVASRESEVANDLQESSRTVDGKEHGLLTDIMLRVLQGRIDADLNHDGQISYGELRSVIQQQAQHYELPYQQSPQLYPNIRDDQKGINYQPIFSKAYNPRSASQSNNGQIGKTALKIYLRNQQVPENMRAELSNVDWVSEHSDRDFVLSVQNGLWTLSAANLEPILEHANISQVVEQIKATQWIKRLQQQSKSSNILQIQAIPTHKGNAFDKGDRLQLQIKSKQAAQILLLNINAEGQVQLLYPINSFENTLVSGGQLKTFPENDYINVQAPFGLDVVVALAMPKSIPNLDKLKPMIESAVSINHGSVRYIEDLIKQQGSVTVDLLPIRTYEKFVAAGVNQ